MKITPDIFFIARTTQCGGYRTVTNNYRAAMESAGINYTLFSSDLLRRQHQHELFSIQTTSPTIVLFYDTPDMLSKIQRTGSAIKLITGTLFETGALPKNWLNPLLSSDEVWVPTEFNMNSFRNGGIPANKLRKVPLCLDTRPYDSRIPQLHIPGKKSFAFLYAYAWPSRKDPSLLLRSYFRAFNAQDDVCLIIKVLPNYSTAKSIFERLLPEYDIQRDLSLPKVISIQEDFSSKQMLSLYDACDVYVSSERAKGWDYPAMEMMALGKPCVSIDWSGSTEFMTAENSFLVPHTGKFVDIAPEDVGSIAYPIYQGHQWPDISVETFARFLREAYEDADKRRRLGATARDNIHSKYSHVVVGQAIRDILEQCELPKTDQRSTLSIPALLTTPAYNQKERASDSPTIKQMTSQARAVALLEQLVIERLAAFADKYTRLAIFPFGAHSKWLISIFEKGMQQGRAMPEIACFLDDNPSSAKIRGLRGTLVPIALPSECPMNMIDAILISSDSAEASMAAHMRSTFPCGKPILELYKKIQNFGPFDKFDGIIKAV